MFTLKTRFAPSFMYIIQRYANVLSVRNFKLKKKVLSTAIYLKVSIKTIHKNKLN